MYFSVVVEDIHPTIFELYSGAEYPYSSCWGIYEGYIFSIFVMISILSLLILYIPPNGSVYKFISCRIKI